VYAWLIWWIHVPSQAMSQVSIVEKTEGTADIAKGGSCTPSIVDVVSVSTTPLR